MVVLAWVATWAGTATPTGVTVPAGMAAPLGGGEEGHTRGLKLCPLQVFAMPGFLDLGRDGEGGRISSSGKEME